MPSAQVYSQNIVGYKTADLAAGNFNMYAVPFTGVGGGGFQLNSSAFSGDSFGAGGLGAADWVMLWVPAIFDYEVYYKYDEDGLWYAVKGDNLFEENYPDGLPVGTAFWYQSRGTSDGNITIAGEVPTASTLSATVTCRNFNTLAYPYPVNFFLNDNTQVDWSDAYGAGGLGAADWVMLWVPAIFDYEVYYKYDEDGLWYAVKGDNLFEVNYPDGLPVGTAFWYQSREPDTLKTSFEVIFKKSY